MRFQERVVAIRVNEEAYAGLNAFAVQNNMMNKSGEPNISMAARTLLFMAIRRVGAEGLVDVNLDNARSEWLERVNGAWRAAMKQITRIGLNE